MALAKEVVNQIGAIREFEKPKVSEAIKVANANKLMVCLSPMEWAEREARLKKEYEKDTKAPGPAGNRIKEDSGVNPALAEAASQFNDALLDEQAKKIEKLAKENERLKDQIAILDACKKHNDKIDRLQIKRLGKEIARLNKIIHEKNEELKRKTKGCCELVAESVDLKEALRKTESLLHDTREANSKNLDSCFKNEDIIDDLKKKLAEKTRLAKKYGKELEDSSLGLCKLEKKLKKKLADKDAILADVAEELRLSNIREKNLTEVCQKYVKEVEDLREKLANKVVDKIDAQALKSAESALAWKEKVICYKEKMIYYKDKEIAEKNEVIDELVMDLKATKAELEGKTKLVEIVRNGSKQYCEYGIAAEKMIQKLAKIIVSKGLVPSDVFERCRLWAKGYRFNPQLPERTDEEEKKLNTAKSNLDDPKEKAYNSFNAKAHNLGLVGSKDGNGILDQLFGVDIAEEGGDHSDVYVARILLMQ